MVVKCSNILCVEKLLLLVLAYLFIFSELFKRRRARLGAVDWASPIGRHRLGAGHLGAGHLDAWTLGRQNSAPDYCRFFSFVFL